MPGRSLLAVEAVASEAVASEVFTSHLAVVIISVHSHHDLIFQN